MSDPTPKTDERPVEWSFDFARLGESFKRLLDSLSGEEEVKTSQFSAEKGTATRADVDVNFSVGTGTVRALSASANLIEAEIVHVGDIEFKAEGDTVKHITLKQKMPVNIITAPLRQGFRAIINRRDLRWTVGLSPEVPLNLEIDGGVGPVTADLTGLQLTGLAIDSGVGTMAITLPAADAAYTTKIDGGVGQVTLNIPEGASGKVEIDGGVGSIEIALPTGTAVQLHTKRGLGSVHVPAHFKLVKEEFMTFRVWQTPGFELADKKLVIYYEGGVGQLKVTAIETV